MSAPPAGSRKRSVVVQAHEAEPPREPTEREKRIKERQLATERAAAEAAAGRLAAVEETGPTRAAPPHRPHGAPPSAASLDGAVY